ncbi:response regulator transcription factor [uncultured Robinsoniella sp.]|uniref:response regulator transcription factor n=1 Tax=uncultured Robinsoniella sp. TaxID=904190 RepID=UPI00374F20BA
MSSILIIEDDEALNTGLSFDLEAENYDIKSAFSLEEGRNILKNHTFDLIILDVNLPDGNGFHFIQELKKFIDTPVIFLTACDLESDAVRGFDLGADDYITKPFSMVLLRRRVAAVIKRCTNTKPENTSQYQDSYLLINFDKPEARIKNQELSLTPTEYKMLKLLTAHPGQLLTHQVMLEHLYDSDGNFVDKHALAVNVNRLRSKIEDDIHKYIKTIYGMGYQWAGENHGC